MEELTLNDLLDIFMENIKPIILTVILFLVFSIIYTNVIIVPMYSASTKIILADSSKALEGTTISNMTTDVALNQKLVATYSEIVKSRKVIENVSNSLKLDEKIENISKNITVSPVEDSEVIDITVENKDPYVASSIANELVTAFSLEVKKIYGIENVNQIDVAREDLNPVNVSLITNLAIFGILGFILSYGISFCIKIFKPNVQTEEEIMKITGKNIIAIIPEIEEGVM